VESGFAQPQIAAISIRGAGALPMCSGARHDAFCRRGRRGRTSSSRCAIACAIAACRSGRLAPRCVPCNVAHSLVRVAWQTRSKPEVPAWARDPGAGAGFFAPLPKPSAHAHRSAEDLMPAWEAGVSCKLLSWPNRWLARPFGRWHHRLALGGRGSDTGRRCSARLRPPAIPPSPSEPAATGFTTSAETPFAPSTCKT